MVNLALVAVADVVTTVPTVGPSWATPAFITALATLVTAITGVIIALKAQGAAKVAQGQVAATHQSVEDAKGQLATVVTQTNGTISALQARIAQLEAMQAGRRALPGPVVDSSASARPVVGPAPNMAP